MQRDIGHRRRGWQGRRQQGHGRFGRPGTSALCFSLSHLQQHGFLSIEWHWFCLGGSHCDRRSRIGDDFGFGLTEFDFVLVLTESNPNPFGRFGFLVAKNHPVFRAL